MKVIIAKLINLRYLGTDFTDDFYVIIVKVGSKFTKTMQPGMCDLRLFIFIGELICMN